MGAIETQTCLLLLETVSIPPGPVFLFGDGKGRIGALHGLDNPVILIQRMNTNAQEVLLPAQPGLSLTPSNHLKVDLSFFQISVSQGASR